MRILAVLQSVAKTWSKYFGRALLKSAYVPSENHIYPKRGQNEKRLQCCVAKTWPKSVRGQNKMYRGQRFWPPTLKSNENVTKINTFRGQNTRLHGQNNVVRGQNWCVRGQNDVCRDHKDASGILPCHPGSQGAPTQLTQGAPKDYLSSKRISITKQHATMSPNDFPPPTRSLHRIKHLALWNSRSLEAQRPSKFV